MHHLERQSGELLNARILHGKTSVTRQPTEKNGRNGLPDVLVTGRTKV